MLLFISKDEFILSEMIRLGFWNEGQGETSEPAELIKSYGKLSRELNDLLKKEREFKNKEKLLREMRKKRMAEAKARRQETQEKQAKKREEKAAAWVIELHALAPEILYHVEPIHW